MKGINTWSYSPYKPFLFESGCPYVSRVVPHENSIHFEWFPAVAPYTVYCREMSVEDFTKLGETNETYFDIENLKTETDYEFYVTSGENKSRIRLARCGKSVGTVVNYLHPEDRAYSFSGRYLCSPSLLVHPDGYYLASMDLFAPGQPQNLTLIFRSDDKGETWYHYSELMPCYWGELFYHNGDVYMMASSTEYGDLLIGKSTDGGKTWGTPTVLLRGSSDPTGAGTQKAPMTTVIHNGRIYLTCDWGAWSFIPYRHSPMIISCKVDDDLLVSENWSISEPCPISEEWEGVAKGVNGGVLEGNIVETPDGKLAEIMRYELMETSEPKYGLIMRYKVNENDPDAPVEFDRVIKFPGNRSKFIIKRDKVSGKYYSLASIIYDENELRARNYLALLSSSDLDNWEITADLLDYRNDDPSKVGFQYVDFDFDGDDLIYLSRTSINGANDYHNANYSTFHRLKNFRNL
ncbi:MAG: hypothetical protein Q4G23_01105 [Clostridia bacterium]|nr:hypothetical protein [Clostridia bacterium]